MSGGAPARSTPVNWGRVLSTTLRVAGAVALLGAVVTFGVGALTGTFHGPFEDFHWYWRAAVATAHGVSPYQSFHGQSSVVMSGFDYPPPAALILRPLALLSHHWAVIAWLWGGIAATVAATVILARETLPSRWPRVSIALIAALLFAPATYNYWHGQINPWILLLLSLGLREYVRGHQVRCGIWLALGADIKLMPAVLLLLLVRRRWWRGVAAMLVTGLGVLGIAAAALPGSLPVWLHSVLPALGRDNGWIYNQSIDGVVSRLFGHSVLHFGPALLWLHVVVLVLDLALLWAAWRAVGPGLASAPAAEYGLFVAAAVLSGTIAWYPHYTALLVPVFAGLGLVAARGPRQVPALTTSLAAFLTVNVVVVPLALSALSLRWLSGVSATGWWWWLLQLYSLPAATALGLIGGLAVALRRGDLPPTAGQRPVAQAVPPQSWSPSSQQ